MHSVYYFPSFLSIAYYFYVESIINQLVGKLVDGVHAGGADYSSCLVRHNLAVIRRAAVVWLFCTLASVRIMLVLYLFRRTSWAETFSGFVSMWTSTPLTARRAFMFQSTP